MYFQSFESAYFTLKTYKELFSTLKVFQTNTKLSKFNIISNGTFKVS